jgi:glycosyltransferase involved in cell wall biosynthesis
MDVRSVDVLAAGPPPSDPYDPTRPAWSLAEGFRELGWSVRVLHPAGEPGASPPADVTAVPVSFDLRRPGAPEEPAEFARAAGRHLRPDLELVVRDPAGLGALGLSRRGRGPRVVAVVHALEVAEYERERAGRAATGIADRIDAWRDRRMVRRLERTALDEADRLFCDGPAVTAALSGAYGASGRRVRELVPPVASPPDIPRRDAARGALGFPTDVPVVATIAAVAEPQQAGVDRAREAFRRVRPLFPGARMVIAGAASPPEPGVTVSPGREVASFAQALSAADLAVFPRRLPGFDPVLVLALRLGLPAIALPGATLPVDPGPAVRRISGDDAGDLASAFADLIADPAARHAAAEPAKEYAARFLPERIAGEVAGAGGPAHG